MVLIFMGLITSAALHHNLGAGRGAEKATGIQRRAVLHGAGAFAAALVAPQASFADNLLDELPPGAITAYNQNWPVIQLATDYFVFELRDQVRLLSL